MAEEKRKSIETQELVIKGNIMCWEGTMIQLSNISCISTMPLELLQFPILSIICLLGGIFAVAISGYLSIALITTGIIWICVWIERNENRKSNTILNIVMNSGNTLSIVIGNRKFLNKILQVLEQIIIEGGVGKQNISININNSTITGNARILNDLNIL